MKGKWEFGIMRDLRDGKTMAELQEAAQERDARASYKPAKLRASMFTNTEAGLCLSTSQGPLPLTQRALLHVARAIDRPGIVADTLQSLPSDATASLLKVGFPEDNYLVSCYRVPNDTETGNTVVRGILSDRYKPVPCAPMVEQALSTLDRAGTGDRDSTRGVTGTDLLMDPHRWNIRLARADWGLPVVTGLDQPGPVPNGIVYPIVDISSDDSGGGAVNLQGGLWRLVCNNGSSLCESSAARRLIHKQGARWSRSVGDLIPADWMRTVEDAIADTVSIPVYVESVLLTALRVHKPTPAEGRIQSAVSHNRLTISTADLARMLSLESLQDEGRLPLRACSIVPVSRWALSQSVAKVGRDHRTAGRMDRAELCESASGQLLTQPLAKAFPDLRELCPA
jgi:hypothetical protein